VIYLVPTIVAVHRECRNIGSIVALNLLVGWTIIGWAAALVWALMSNEVQKQPLAQAAEKKCPWCAEMIKLEAKICRFCGREV
jgi:hypothetical protein